jgi:hypothetical protein
MTISRPRLNFTSDWKMLHERYRVFPDGRILSLYWNESIRKRPLVMNGGTDTKGLNHVHLQTDRGPMTISRARVIASLFVPNPLGKNYVVFKDGNKRNVHASNLVWSDTPFSDVDLARMAEGKKVFLYALTDRSQAIKVYSSLTDVCKHIGVTQKTIYRGLETNTPVKGYYINRYERGSESYQYMLQLLQSDSEERHLQHV